MSRNPWSRGRILTVPGIPGIPGIPGVPLGPGRGARILFGRMYEDFGVELRAFPPPGSRVLCIASAGDTAAALAGAGYDVTAVDINPAQLDYARARLAEGLPARTGTAERMMAVGRRAAATVLPAWRPAAMEQFLRLDDPVEQARHWRAELDGPGLRLLMGAGLRATGLLAVAVQPAFQPAIPRWFDRVLRNRILRTVSRHPNADNPWIWRILAGKECPGASGTDSRETTTANVNLVCADVVDHLEQAPRGSFDAVTLSNILDGPDQQFARRLRAAVRHAVRPGGVVVIRSLREPGAEGPGEAAADRASLWGVVRVVTLAGENGR